jgi:hypothetical protein
MPHYIIDKEFIGALPDALRQVLDAFHAASAKENTKN